MRIYGFFYGSMMRLAHRFNWHYAPAIGPLEDSTPKYQKYMRWCKWCGMRDTFYRIPAVDAKAIFGRERFPPTKTTVHGDR